MVNTQYNIQMIQDSKLESYIILLTNVTAINSIKIYKKENKNNFQTGQTYIV